MIEYLRTTSHSLQGIAALAVIPHRILRQREAGQGEKSKLAAKTIGRAWLELARQMR
jgi:hypothetical protein